MEPDKGTDCQTYHRRLTEEVYLRQLANKHSPEGNHALQNKSSLQTALNRTSQQALYQRTVMAFDRKLQLPPSGSDDAADLAVRSLADQLTAVVKSYRDLRSTGSSSLVRWRDTAPRFSCPLATRPGSQRLASGSIRPASYSTPHQVEMCDSTCA